MGNSNGGKFAFSFDCEREEKILDLNDIKFYKVHQKLGICNCINNSAFFEVKIKSTTFLLLSLLYFVS
jgi:hypothetical protein